MTTGRINQVTAFAGDSGPAGCPSAAAWPGPPGVDAGRPGGRAGDLDPGFGECLPRADGVRGRRRPLSVKLIDLSSGWPANPTASPRRMRPRNRLARHPPRRLVAR
jgi:hypothetical protein